VTWRRWRAPAGVVVLILLGGVVIALLQGPPVNRPLDPRDTGPFGAHALAALLRGRGQTVTRVSTVAAAMSSGANGPATTLVITSPELLDYSQRRVLSRALANLLIVGPGLRGLGRLAPGVALAGSARVVRRPPACALPGARLAGDVDMGGAMLRSAGHGSRGAVSGLWHCYPARLSTAAGDRMPAFLVRYPVRGRTVTVLGTGVPLTNDSLGRDGNAALAMNLLGTSRVVWLVPENVAPAASRSRSLESLYPRGVYLVAIEIGLAVVLAALWRMRRFGPLVPEPLPVVVRASETVEGHGRLYRSRRARDRAAAALRAATLTRIVPLLGLPRDVSPDVTCQELAGRTGKSPEEIRSLLYGPVPRDDAALVALATRLENLEGQVLTP
jgi:Domain of unknown function (DUF4350)